MKKILTFTTACLLALTITSCDNNPTITTNPCDKTTATEDTSTIGAEESTDQFIDNEDDVHNYINSLMRNTPSYIPYWNQESFKGKWNYIDGVMIRSLLNLYSKTNESIYLDFSKCYVNNYIDSSGNFIGYNGKIGYDISIYELDSICASQNLFDLYEYTNDARYNTAIEYTYSQIMTHPRTTDGSFWHKYTYHDQVWLDGMYMLMPFYVQYANKYPNKTVTLNEKTISLYEDIKLQYQNIRENMYDEETKLYHHGYDQTKSIFWANQDTGCSQSYWLRSMGWYVISLVDTISYLNDGDLKTYLTGLFHEAITGILQYEDNNLFYNVINLKDVTKLVSSFYTRTEDKYITNYKEASGSSMIAYSLMKGSRLNILDSSFYNKGKAIYDKVVSEFLTKDNNTLHLSGICITAGLGPERNPYRDGTVEYYLSESVGIDDAKGTGPFIMAYTETIK